MNELVYIFVAIFASITYTVWFSWLLKRSGGSFDGNDFGMCLVLGTVSGLLWIITLPIAIIAIASWTLTNRMKGT